MPSCSVITCKNRSVTKNYIKDGVTYHVFPNNSHIKEKWINATGRGPNWFPVKGSVICSDHFQEKCFQPLKKARRLFDWAIPTEKNCKIFATTVLESSTSKEDSNENLSNKPSTREIAYNTCVTCGHQLVHNEQNQTSQIKTLNNVSAESLSCSQDYKSSKFSFQLANVAETDVHITGNWQDLPETPSNRQMREKISQCESMLKKQKNQIKNLQKKTSRYKKKIKTLENILEELNKKNLLNTEQTTHLENLGDNDLLIPRSWVTPESRQGCNGGNFIGTEGGVGVFKFDLSESEPKSEPKSEPESEPESEAGTEVVVGEDFFI